ncbi:FAD-dependent oxidoreductase [Ornithinimicrobium panacihumi]|uniref:FAD-dependent oxidoreductase n=1 Tax=Ornithinimicrobium panacihumi TaxID=2008449 RepID=UPI003F8AFF7B
MTDDALTGQSFREHWAVVPTEVPRYSHVVVWGGGLSGCSAAVAAARNGADVVLLEPTHLLGGQAGPGGVSAMDVTWYYQDLIEAGMWGEFVLRCRTYYRDVLGKSCNTSQYRDESFSVNPVIVDYVLSHMLLESGVRVVRNVDLLAVEANGRVVVLETHAGPISGRITVDASEDGSLLELSQLPRRIGNIVASKELDSGALIGVRIQDITQTAMIRDYSDVGLPDDLVLEMPPPGYDSRRRILQATYPHGPGKARLGTRQGFAGYRGAPDLASNRDYSGARWHEITRTSLNYANDCSAPAGFLVEHSERVATERRAIATTYAVLFYLQQELKQPWGLVRDEGFAEGPDERVGAHRLELYPRMSRHLPPIPYIRESVRLLGRRTLTGKRIFRARQRTAAPWDPTVIAIGTYPPDLHGGRSDDDLEKDLLETMADKPPRWQEGPFPICLDHLIPERDVAIIAAEKNISASRIASSAVRLHPTVMAIGHAAGVLAALSAERQLLPSRIEALEVQSRLAQEGASLTPLPVRGLPKDPEDRAAAVLAVARGAVDTSTTHVRPEGDMHRCPLLTTDMARAVRIGRAMTSTQR